MKPIVIREKHPLAIEAAARWTELRTERSRYEGDWNAIARLMLPHRGGFGLDNTATRQQEKPLSSAPARALSNFAAAVYGTTANPATSWFTLATGDEQLNAWRPMAEWLELATQKVFLSFSPSVSTFHDQLMPLCMDLAGLGNGAQFTDMDAGLGRIRDLTISPNEVVVAVGAFGEVIEAVRCTHMTAAALAKEYGLEALPDKLQEDARKRSAAVVPVYHHMVENPDYRRGALGPRGKPWRSVHALADAGGWLLREAGYQDMPLLYPRWQVESGATYGTGPAMVALASVRAHARMREATLRAAQRAADPTLLAPNRDDWPLHGNVVPGGMIYGGVNIQGQPILRPLETSGNISLTIEQERQVMAEVEAALYVTLLNFQNRTGMTPQEIAAIEAEKARLWAPNLGRFQTEYLAPKVEGRFKLLLKAGQIPPPPDAGQRGGQIPLVVRYTSAAARAQQAQESMEVRQLVADIAPLAQLKPRLLDRIDEDALIEALAAASGATPRILRPREEADRIAAARAEQQQAAQAMMMAQAGAGAAKDAAAAEAMMQKGAP